MHNLLSCNHDLCTLVIHSHVQVLRVYHFRYCLKEYSQLMDLLRLWDVLVH